MPKKKQFQTNLNLANPLAQKIMAVNESDNDSEGESMEKHLPQA